METTTIDTAANALESSGFFIRKVGRDGYRIHHQATLRKVVSDRRASLDENNDIKPAMRALIESEFKKKSTLPIAFFPTDSSSVGDATKLTLVVANPDTEWERGRSLRTNTRLDGETRAVAKTVSRFLDLVHTQGPDAISGIG